MPLEHERFLTSLSRFAVTAAIALGLATGCADHELTSLAGDIPCGSMTCGDGELCMTFEPHPSEALQYSCVAVPTSCEVYDCQSDTRGCSDDCPVCPSCITGLCGYLTTVDGRELGCLGF